MKDKICVRSNTKCIVMVHNNIFEMLVKINGSQKIKDLQFIN